MSTVESGTKGREVEQTINYTALVTQTFRVVRDSFGTVYLPMLAALVPLFAGLGVLGLAIAGGALGESGTLVYACVAFVGASMAYALGQAAVTYATCELDAGRRPSIGASVRRGADRLFPVIGMSLLLTLAIMAGSMLFLVPGIIIAVTYLVLVPVIVMEGPRGAWRRAAALSKGHRPGLFMAMLVMGVVSLVIQILGYVAGILSPSGIVSTLVSQTFAAFACGLGSVFNAVVYARLAAICPPAASDR
jgi:hypothetical protein